ncbi:1,6-anhydro-N-acetylmuramyl-L-alanine amidase AmpD [uncultured Neptuniibacter sp.]|uniref:1,6-anhydro-N-acetylmuramyl-L-alanine amidase AmpD n=1 Tax=uncultured Neptuniibacter sp. TaxID=502143 RepID=UPI0026367A7D|nr:1,6-anhydro-N-acetylmuramyl-L-alanine amidase AmpD [uncultured Neptuniibacter sp.]
MKINNCDWLEGVAVVPSPNFNSRPVCCDISLLVIHNISLPPGCYGGGYIARFFQNELPVEDHPFFCEVAEMKVSAHLLIERSGHVVQFVPLTERAWHAGVSCFKGREACNDFSIGIEMEGSDHDPYTDAQYDSLIAFTKRIQALYPEITKDRIVGHSDIAPGRKTDPGPAFDWARYRCALK